MVDLYELKGATPAKSVLVARYPGTLAAIKGSVGKPTWIESNRLAIAHKKNRDVRWLIDVGNGDTEYESARAVSGTPNACRVCGLLQPDLPWGITNKDPTFLKCPCCGTVFGRDDAAPDKVRAKRAAWVGSAWNGPELGARPAAWDASAQLAQVPARFK